MSPKESAIEAESLVRIYQVKRARPVRALDGLSLSVKQGEIFGLLGENGMLFEFLTYPMTRGEFLVGKILFNSLLALVQALITVGAGTLLLGIPLRWERAGFLVPGVVLGTAGWFVFLTTFALRIRRNDMFNTLSRISY